LQVERQRARRCPARKAETVTEHNARCLLMEGASSLLDSSNFDELGGLAFGIGVPLHSPGS
jgi:hypothetical protein